MITWIIVFALALLSIVVFVFALRSQQDAEALEDRLAGTIDEEAAAHPHQAGGIEPLPEEYQMVKRRYSGFFGTDLEILLKGLGVEHIYAVGLLTDVCVHYTCADAHQHDYHIHVVREAAGGSSLAAHEAALAAIEYLQHGSVISEKEVCE